MIASEVRRAARTVFRRPALAASLVLTMALGIGATTSVFSVIDAVLLRAVPYSRPSELVELWTLEGAGFSHPRLDAERIAAWVPQTALFARVERYADKSMFVTSGDEPAEIRAVAVSFGLLPMLGVTPARGRGFTSSDTAADAPNVALVSEAFYRQQLHGVPFDQKPTVRLDDRLYWVIGVMSPGFRYPRGIVSVWLPSRTGDAMQPDAFNYVARLQPQLTHDAARARFEGFAKQLDAATPRKEGWAVAPAYLDDPHVNKDVRVALWLLAAAVGCVLIIACANTANLLLVQAMARQREMAIRGALGATRARLVQQLLLESAVLALPAVALGIGIAYWAVASIVSIIPSELLQFGANSVEVDARVLGFSVVAGLVTWLLCGVGPAWQASRARADLVSGQRTSTAGRGMHRLRNGLVVAELALSLMLLAGAGLFMRTLSNLLAVDPGFDAAHTLIANLTLATLQYPTPERRGAAVIEIGNAVRAVPGVRSVTFAGGLPPHAGITFGDRLEAEGSSAPAKTGDVIIPFTDIDTVFFSTMRVPLLRGRTFTAADMVGTERVAIIDPGLARTLWPNTDPVGRRFRLSATGKWITVVGVAGTVKLMGADDRAYPYAMYTPRRPNPRFGGVSMAVATTGDPSTSIEAVKRAIRSAGPLVPITNIGSAAVEFAAANAKPRFVLVLLSVFAGLALILATIGIYGVLSYSVAQRTREIGIRMALGARAVDIVSSVFREGVLLAIGGTALGLGCALLTTRLASTLLFGVAPADVGVLATVSVLLIGTAIVAMLAPTVRASRVSPLVAMTPDA